MNTFESNKTASTLTLHGIKQICESESISRSLKDHHFVLQVIDVSLLQEVKRNLKARIQLSDGVSKMTCMVTEKAYDELVSDQN